MKPASQGEPACWQPCTVPRTDGLCSARVSLHEVQRAELPGSSRHRSNLHRNPGHVVQISSLPQTAGRRPDSQSLLDVTMESMSYFCFASCCFYSSGAEGREQKPCGQRRQPLWTHRRENSLTCTAHPQPPSEVQAFVNQLQPTGAFVKIGSPW